MSVVAFAAGHFAVLLVFALVCYGLGRTILRRLPFNNICEEIAVSTTLGIGVIGTAVLVAGLLRVLYTFTVVLFFVAAALASAGTWRTTIERLRVSWRSREFRRGVILAAVIALIAWPVFYGALYPPHTFDATMYHLPKAKIFARDHQLEPLPYIRLCVSPDLQEMLFTVMLLLSDDLAAQLTQFLAALLVALAIGGWLTGHRRASAGLLAAAIWFGDPQVVHAATIAYIDVGLTCFITIAVIAFVNWLKTRNNLWIGVSGVMAGFAAASKYTALLIGLLLGAYLLWHLLRRKDWKPLVLYAAMAVAVSGPWYARNLYYTGNPVTPFMAGVFGPGCWSKEDITAIVEEQKRYGAGHDFVHFLRLPFDLTFHEMKFFREVDVSPFLFLSLPLIVVFAPFRRELRPMLLLVLITLVFWFATAQVVRYLLPIFPLLAILLAATIADIANLVRMQHRVAVGIIFSLLSLTALIPGYQWVLEMNRGRGKIPTTARERDTFLQRFPGYRCVQWLNKEGGTKYRVYAYVSEYLVYFMDGTRVGDVVGPGRYPDMQANSAAELLAQLNRHDVDYIADFRPAGIGMAGYSTEPFFRDHFELVCSSPSTRVWRIHQQPLATPATELLMNGSFETVTPGGIPNDWDPAGAPQRKAGDAHTGAAAEVLDDTNTLTQTIENLVPWSLYQASTDFRGAAKGAELRITIEWLDPDGVLLETDTQTFPAGDGWQHAELPSTAPAEAAGANLTISGYKGLVVVDDVSFRLAR